MNNVSDYIEVEITTYRDMLGVVITDFIIAIIMSFFAILRFGYFWAGLIEFSVIGGILPLLQLLWVPSHSAYRFDFMDDAVVIHFSTRKRAKTKQIPFDQFEFVRMDWNEKKSDVRYFDKKKPNNYSLLPVLSTINHWDKQSLDKLLSFAEKYDIPVKKWSSPFGFWK